MKKIKFELPEEAEYFLNKIIEENGFCDVKIKKNKIIFKEGGSNHRNEKRTFLSMLYFIERNGKIKSLKNTTFCDANFIRHYSLKKGKIRLKINTFAPSNTKKGLSFSAISNKLLFGKVYVYERWMNGMDGRESLSNLFWQLSIHYPFLNVLKPLFIPLLQNEASKKSTNNIILRTSKYQLKYRDKWEYTPISTYEEEKEINLKSITWADQVIINHLDKRKLKINNKYVPLNEYTMKINYNQPVYEEDKQVGKACDYCIFRLQQVASGKCNPCQPHLR